MTRMRCTPARSGGCTSKQSSQQIPPDSNEKNRETPVLHIRNTRTTRLPPVYPRMTGYQHHITRPHREHPVRFHVHYLSAQPLRQTKLALFTSIQHSIEDYIPRRLQHNFVGYASTTQLEPGQLPCSLQQRVRVQRGFANPDCEKQELPASRLQPLCFACRNHCHVGTGHYPS